MGDVPVVLQSLIENLLVFEQWLIPQVHPRLRGNGAIVPEAPPAELTFEAKAILDRVRYLLFLYLQQQPHREEMQASAPR